MKSQLYIGQSQLRGALSKYAARFNLFELRAEQGRVPRPAILRRWPGEVSPDFVFSVLLSRSVGAFGSGAESGLEFGLEVANALGAKWLVIQTDPTVGPSQRSRERLKSLFERLQVGDRRVAWEPHGVWQDEEALAWTRELGVHLVRDVTRGDPVEEETLYVRVPGLGIAARLSSGALEKAAESLVHAKEAFVVLGGEGAARAAQTLRSLIRDSEDWQGKRGGTTEGPYVFDEESIDDDSATDDEDFEADEVEEDSEELNEESEEVEEESDDEDCDDEEDPEAVLAPDPPRGRKPKRPLP
jgi:uncharacterized protein YecE (DUF72 family)